MRGPESLSLFLFATYLFFADLADSIARRIPLAGYLSALKREF